MRVLTSGLPPCGNEHMDVGQSTEPRAHAHVSPPPPPPPERKMGCALRQPWRMTGSA